MKTLSGKLNELDEMVDSLLSKNKSLKSQNTKLREALEGSLFYLTGYIVQNGSNPTLRKRLKDFQEALNSNK